MRRVLLTDGNYKHTLSLARQFHKLGFRVDALGSKFGVNRYSRFMNFVGDQFVSLQNRQELDDLVRLLERNSYDLLVPVGAVSVENVSKMDELLAKYTKIVLPDRDSVCRAFDKVEVSRIAVEYGIAVPKTMLATDVALDSFSNIGKFCVKNRLEFGHKIQTKYFDIIDSVIDFLDPLTDLERENLIVQERIYGPGEAFFGLYENGSLVDGYTHRRIRETPISGGSSTCAESTSAQDVFDSGKAILDELEWHGPAMVEFKRDITNGKLFLMEVNPKFWGSLDLGIAIGVEFAQFLSNISSGQIQEQRIGTNARPIVRFQWPFDGDFANLRHTAVRTAVLRDFINPRVRKNIDLTDPFPYLARAVFSPLRRIACTRLAIRIRQFSFRKDEQGLKVALWRFFEESLGFPIFSDRSGFHGIFLGPQISRLGKWKLRRRGIISSVSLQSEFSDIENNLDLERHLHLPCVEYETLTDEALIEGVSFLSETINAGHAVYIHCREGRSRATYLAVAYLVNSGLSIDEAIVQLKQERPFIDLLPNQRKSIERVFLNDLDL